MDDKKIVYFFVTRWKLGHLDIHNSEGIEYSFALSERQFQIKDTIIMNDGPLCLSVETKAFRHPVALNMFYKRMILLGVVIFFTSLYELF